MANAQETIRKFQSGLEPYARPREQADYIRRILALHIKSSSDGPLSQPLALAGGTVDDETSPTNVRGVHGEYLDALRANIAARRQYEELIATDTADRRGNETTSSPETSILEEKLAILKLQTKRRRLSVVRRYLDQLVDQPAASPDFLDPNHIFDGSRSLPSIPAEVMDNLVEGKSSGSPDLHTKTSQLEKVALRTKLLLRQEERLLAEAKARLRNRQEGVSSRAKLEALLATRSELIGWIEAELASSSAEDAPNESASPPGGKRDPQADQATITRSLAEIKDKYSRYLESRSQLISLASDHPGITGKPDLKPAAPGSTTLDATPQPVNHLIVPYIEELLALGKSQKGLISEKSHAKAALGRQTRQSYEELGYLAEESQLLLTYPMKESLKRRSGLIDELTSRKSDVPEISKRIKPWVFASDSAKIANLESVAGTIEEGQVALDGSLEALHELEDLLGLRKDGPEAEEGKDESGEDTWLAAPETPGPKDNKKHTEKQRAPKRDPGDIWSVLHGNLGLIGQGDVA